MKSIRISHVESDVPVPFYRDNDQHNATIDLSQDGLLTAAENHLGRTVPMRQWNSLDLAWTISPDLTLDGINALLDEVAPLAERVHDGQTSEWDGNNFVGRFTEDADDAFEEITTLCERASEDASGSVLTTMWDCGEWEVAHADGVADTDLGEWAEQEVADCVEAMSDGYGTVYAAPGVAVELASWVRDERAAEAAEVD